MSLMINAYIKYQYTWLFKKNSFVIFCDASEMLMNTQYCIIISLSKTKNSFPHSENYAKVNEYEGGNKSFTQEHNRD